ncbi:hypothetical protein HYU14_02675 [Candidatus Woesearchaeota archaeon]|nr:hypothetical protein [Candidatus Woesearchaeota archaeon]
MADDHGHDAPAHDAHGAAPAAPSASPAAVGNFLEDLVKGTESLWEGVKGIPEVGKDVMRVSWDVSIALGSVGLSYSCVGMDALILGGGFGTGTLVKNLIKGESPSLNELSKSIRVGAILAIPTHYTFEGVGMAGAWAKAHYGRTAGIAARAALGVANIPPFIEIDEMIRRMMIADYKPVPWEERWRKNLATTAMFSPLVAVNLNLPEFFPGYNPMFGAAFNTTVYSAAFGVPRQKKEDKPAHASVGPQEHN